MPDPPSAATDMEGEGAPRPQRRQRVPTATQRPQGERRLRGPPTGQIGHGDGLRDRGEVARQVVEPDADVECRKATAVRERRPADDRRAGGGPLREGHVHRHLRPQQRAGPARHRQQHDEGAERLIQRHLYADGADAGQGDAPNEHFPAGRQFIPPLPLEVVVNDLRQAEESEHWREVYAACQAGCSFRRSGAESAPLSGLRAARMLTRRRLT
ncbi:hypothetical protein LzC2_37130 [Planctomycetes bacterium LzC2]|uniref:Uncharacterized protein n=1 Tax=Alienimonas chondri TaxID=2681879 RepID=A0ABX1VJG9_9PLAN|nr:hypothetical protein [Alienimonas chondri]